ncbi:MAG: PilZ domain-containing protein [Fimbriimonadales bacterium]|nr:PilZ domain-containing protein [Fimbriimonadales bacterium]
MGTVQVSESQTDWVSETLKQYSNLLGHDPLEEHSDFAAGRAAIHNSHGIPYPEALDFQECRIEFGVHRIEGELRSEGQVGRFSPSIPSETQPKLGEEVRVRHADGITKAVAVGRQGSDVILVRAPTRRERRLHRRIEVSGVALVSLAKKEESGSIEDLSEGGTGLSLPMPIEVGDSVHILLRLHGKKSLPIECDGIVTSCRPVLKGPDGQHRIGVKFLDLSPRLLDRIRRAMRQSSD